MKVFRSDLSDQIVQRILLPPDRGKNQTPVLLLEIDLGINLQLQILRDFFGEFGTPGCFPTAEYGVSFPPLSHAVGSQACCRHNVFTMEVPDCHDPFSPGWWFLDRGGSPGGQRPMTGRKIILFGEPPTMGVEVGVGEGTGEGSVGVGVAAGALPTSW